MNELKKERTEHRVLNIAIIGVLFLILTFIILRQSPLHPWVNKDTMTDSSVFKTISLQMAHGYMPYRDTFDHKGPLLYIINFVGDRISTYRGVWVVEFAFIWVTLILMYLLGRLYCDRIKAFLAVVACGGLMMAYFLGGNLCEEYAMPFIALGAYVFARYFRFQKVSKLSLILCGASCGCVLMLRPNMVGVWVAGCLAVLVGLIKNHEIKKIWDLLLYFVIGLVLTMAPIIIWLAANNALVPCMEDYLLFNFSYCSGKWLGKIEAFFLFSSNPITIISIICSIILLIKGRNESRWLGFLMLFVSLLSVCTSGLYGGAENYGLVLVPIVVMPIAMVMEKIQNYDLNAPKTPKVIAAYTVLIFVLGLCSTDYIYWFEKTVEAYQNPDNDMKSPTTYSVCKLIEECTQPEDRISVLGNEDIVYLMSNRLPATKYSYQSPIATYKEDLLDEYYSQLETELPKAIVFRGDERMLSFLEDNDYYLYGTVEDDGNSVYVYTRADSN